MYKKPQYRRTGLNINTSTEGEPIEIKIERMINNKEPLDDGKSPLLYTERKEGIRASTNIRTDRWEIAVEASDKVAKSYKARREEKGAKILDMKKENDSGAESIQGTDGNVSK